MRRRAREPERGVVVAQRPLLDLLRDRGVRRSQQPDTFVAQRLGRGDVLGGADGLVLGPDPLVVGNDPAVAEHPSPLQVADGLDPAADDGRVDRVVLAVQADVVVPRQPARDPPADERRDRRQRQHRRPSASIRSLGAQPSAHRERVFTVAGQLLI